MRSLVILAAALAFPALCQGQPLVHPSYGSNFEGPALKLACVATLKSDGKDGLVNAFRRTTAVQRRSCLAELLQSLTPAPEFTPEEFRRALRQTSPGSYDLDTRADIYPRMTDRIRVNEEVARGIAGLASAHLIDDPAVLRPLIECLSHPMLDVGAYCNRALVDLTRHSYGELFFGRWGNSPPETVENRQRAIADWTDLSGQLASGHPIFDTLLASTCQSAVREMAAGLLAVLKASPVAASYVDRLTNVRISPDSGRDEAIFVFDVGSHIAANWPRRENPARIAIMISRPGIPNRTSHGAPAPALSEFPAPDYRETFASLDLEVRFRIETADEQLRRASLDSVVQALAGLRALDAARAPQKPLKEDKPPILYAEARRDCAPWDGSAFEISIQPVAGRQRLGPSTLHVAIWQQPDLPYGGRFTFPDATGKIGAAYLQSSPDATAALRGSVWFVKVKDGNPVEGQFDFLDPQGRRYSGKFAAKWISERIFCG